MLKTWPRTMKEVLISRLNGKAFITPVDMDGETHHSKEYEDIGVILAYFGAHTAHIEEGNVCFRGNKLCISVEVVKANSSCLVVKIVDTSGEEPE
jgi:hypothetical protein